MSKTGKPRVLLVMPAEAGEDVRKAAGGAEADWHVVANCREAYDALTQDEDFDLVVSEVMLADGNWYCVLNAMVRKGSDAKLIVTSDDGRNPPDVASYGALAFLRRPFDADGERTLRAAMDGRRVWSGGAGRGR